MKQVKQIQNRMDLIDLGGEFDLDLEDENYNTIDVN